MARLARVVVPGLPHHMVPVVLDDLEVNPFAGSLLTEEHGDLLAGLVVATMNLSQLTAECQLYDIIRGTRY